MRSCWRCRCSCGHSWATRQTCSAYDCLEVLPLGCNKGTALDRLSRHLGLTMADCMAFGDAMNDKEMLGRWGTAW